MIIKKLCEIFNKVNHRSNERAKGIYNASLPQKRVLIELLSAIEASVIVSLWL
jgi:hypothetical protein